MHSAAAEPALHLIKLLQFFYGIKSFKRNMGTEDAQLCFLPLFPQILIDSLIQGTFSSHSLAAVSDDVVYFEDTFCLLGILI